MDLGVRASLQVGDLCVRQSTGGLSGAMSERQESYLVITERLPYFDKVETLGFTGQRRIFAVDYFRHNEDASYWRKEVL